MLFSTVIRTEYLAIQFPEMIVHQVPNISIHTLLQQIEIIFSINVLDKISSKQNLRLGLEFIPNTLRPAHISIQSKQEIDIIHP